MKSRVLALQTHIIAHDSPSASAATAARPTFRNKKGGGFDPMQAETARCASVFVEPVEWMLGPTADDGAAPVEGRLACPACDAKLGSFNWAGSPCSCGAWVAPAFALHAAKVDLN
ncbi:hypothetical protein HK405_014532 [Cladochytrium tenue]|nr:hypothetical protein HK405_014532 [Cladochytrium tenue]